MPRFVLPAAAGLLFIPLAAPSARAQLAPVPPFDFREVSVRAQTSEPEGGGDFDSDSGAPFPAYADFDAAIDADAGLTPGIRAQASASQVSRFSPTSLEGVGSASASLQIADLPDAAGVASGSSAFDLRFAVTQDTPVLFDLALDASGVGSGSRALLQRLGQPPSPPIVNTATSVSLALVLAPGNYILQVFAFVNLDESDPGAFAGQASFRFGLHVVPAPGGAGALLLAGLWGARRRR